MAPVDANVLDGVRKLEALTAYLEDDIPKEVFERYDTLWTTEDPEETPYKSKYEGRELLKKALDRIDQLLGELAPDVMAPGLLDRANEMVARLLLFMGKNLYFCEEVPDAERQLNRSLERYLRNPLRTEPYAFCYIQDLFNQLGMLWCARGMHADSMNFLRRAQIMYLNRPAAVRETHEKQAEAHYTLTMFYLAQAYGGLQKSHLSARFCAATMSQQLEHNLGERTQEQVEKDPFDCKDWVRNCASLSDFFQNECMFWTAEYLLHSAQLMCERCEALCGFKPEGIEELQAECTRDLGILYSTRLKFAKTCVTQPALCEEVWRGERKPQPAKSDEAKEGTKLTFRTSADAGKVKEPNGGTGPIKWDAVFPEVVHLEDEEAEDNRLAEEQLSSSAPPEKDAGAWLELAPAERVRLPVHFRHLHTAVAARVRRANTTFIELRGDLTEAFASAYSAAPVTGTDEDGKEQTVDLADIDKRQFPSCAGASFESVRELFKLGNHFLRHALSHFLLDGWVTEHIRILQEQSQMYRTLAHWEKDPKRVSGMLKRRAKLLAPLVEALNPKAFISFYRQLCYELGEILQELFTLKAGIVWNDDDDDGGHGPDINQDRVSRCNNHAKESIKYYTLFIESYHTSGKVPEKIEVEQVRAYLTARLHRSRLGSKMIGLPTEETVDGHVKALREYEWMVDYARRNPEVRTHPEVNMDKEIGFCEDMVGMLPARISRIAAKGS